MTKQDRQIYDAVRVRQDNRFRKIEAIRALGKDTSRFIEQLLSDTESVMDIVGNLNSELSRLEKRRR